MTAVTGGLLRFQGHREPGSHLQGQVGIRPAQVDRDFHQTIGVFIPERAPRRNVGIGAGPRQAVAGDEDLGVGGNRGGAKPGQRVAETVDVARFPCDGPTSRRKALLAGEPREGRHGLYELSKRVLALAKQVHNEQADRGD